MKRGTDRFHSGQIYQKHSHTRQLPSLWLNQTPTRFKTLSSDYRDRQNLSRTSRWQPFAKHQHGFNLKAREQVSQGIRC